MNSTNQKLRQNYKGSINEVFYYIDKNLDSDLSLQTLSRIALFSPYHFHRIFKLLTNETLNEYVTRRRIEKAALDLLHKNTTSKEIAAKYGFNDHTSFSRAFKRFYGMSPSQFKKQHPNKISKIRQLKSKNGQVYPTANEYICIINKLNKWITMNANIDVKEMPSLQLAYIPCTGPQNMSEAYQKLIRWASSRGLMLEDTTPMTIYHDSFKVTDHDKVRMSACIPLNKAVEVSGEIRLKEMNPGKCIIGSFEITTNEYEKSWKGLFLWMNENGYEKGDEDPFEIYHNNFHEHPKKIAFVDFCIPIK